MARDSARALAYLGVVEAAAPVVAASALAHSLALDRDRDRDRAHVNEIIDAIEAAQKRWQQAEGEEGEQLLARLASTHERALQLRELLLDHLRLRPFLEAMATLPREESRNEWVSDLRPRLTNARIDWLLDMEPAALRDLLPRLAIDNEVASDESALSLFLTWLQAEDAGLCQQAALLLAETDHLWPEMIPSLAKTLRSTEDLTRYRTQQALMRRRQASTIDAVALRMLARWDDGEDNLLVSTYGGWSLKEVQHNDPALLKQWIEGNEESLLNIVYLLAEDCWPLWVGALREGPTARQKAMLHATGWLLRHDQLLKDIMLRQQVMERLLTLGDSDDGAVSVAAYEALGHLPAGELRPAAIERLLATPPSGHSRRAAGQMALARLVRGLDDAQRERVEETLWTALPEVSAAAALLDIINLEF